ncbi:hypothetical protein BX666DRAFT_2131043 [Dichotomocladium elegans]|nr:hypothetical protein BX666DRAFT_2131043 [Dichotomocladium elegans]
MELRQAAIIPQTPAAPTISTSPASPAGQARDPVTTRPSKGKKPAGHIPRQTTAPASALKIASAAPKKPAKTQAVRAFQEASGPSQYTFVYIPCRRHLCHHEVRQMLAVLKIPQSRVLDVQFPAKGTVALLVHTAFHDELVEKLKVDGVNPRQSFDPLAAEIVGNTEHANKPAAERALLAKSIFANRMLRSCARMPRPLGYSVARFFASLVHVIGVFIFVVPHKRTTGRPTMPNTATARSPYNK